MGNFRFFIDTADTDYISNLWDQKLSIHFDVDKFSGITTNPSSMSKVGVTNLAKFENQVEDLVRLVGDITRPEMEVWSPKPTVYVQVPNSHMPNEEMFEWARYVRSFGNDSVSISLKIPPYYRVLEYASYLADVGRVVLNVTGVADAATALRCFSYYEIHHVSLIPGRMHEVGIDGTKHVQYVTQTLLSKDRVIAGSMRTFDQLRDMVEINSIPTIGTRVWDKFYSGEYEWDWLDQIIKGVDTNIVDSPPHIDERSEELSTSFFKLMDEFARPLYEEMFGTQTMFGKGDDKVADVVPPGFYPEKIDRETLELLKKF